MIDDPAFKVLMANAEAMKRGALSLWTIYENKRICRACNRAAAARLAAQETRKQGSWV